MSNERLLARLRDPNEMTCADRIEALEQQVADLLANVPCACGYDSPTDVCMKHLPLVRNLTARAEKAEAALKEAVGFLAEADRRIIWEGLGFGNDFADSVDAFLAKHGEQP